MSGKVVTIEPSTAPPWHLRPAARAAVGLARVLARLSPRHLRRVMTLLARGAQPAEEVETLRARNAVVAVSVRCAGPRCLQRSIATALLCRIKGRWPQWCTGVRTQPFQAHAWVAVAGRPIGENINDIQFFYLTMSVQAGGISG